MLKTSEFLEKNMRNKLSFSIILLLTLNACLANNEPTISPNLDITPSSTFTSLPITSAPSVDCKFNNLDYPLSSQFTPIDGENAIAYSNSESAGGLALFFPDTESKTIIHQLGISGVDTSFAWSPTGTKIAFLHTKVIEGRMDSESYLMLADLSKGTICPLLDSSLSYTSTIQLFWSPDGKLITWSNNGSMSKLNLENGIIENFASNAYNFQWIDSNHIAFIQTTEEKLEHDLVIQSLDTQSTTIILSTSSTPFDFSFSPDNKWLVYSYSKQGELLQENYSNLINLTTGVETELGKGTFSYWSPNSQYLLGSRGYDGIYLIQPNLSNQVVSLDFFGCLYKETWSKDSMNFAISLCKDGTKKATVGIYNIEEMKLLESSIEIYSPVIPAWNSH